MLPVKGYLQRSTLFPLLGAFFAFLLVLFAIFYFLSGTEGDSALHESAPAGEKEFSPSENTEVTDNPVEIAEGEDKIVLNANLQNTDFDKNETAHITQNHILCDKISDENLRNACWDDILYSQALRDSSQRKCEMLRDENTRIRCTDQVLFDIIKTRKTFTECEKITSSILQKRCYQVDAREKMMNAKTIEDCSEIMIEEERRSCRDFFVAKIIQSQDNPKPELCEILPEQESKDQCFLQIAIKKAKAVRDLAPCHELSEKTSRISCLKTMQDVLQDEEMTMYINEGNVEACQDFPDTERRIECRNGALVIRAQNDGKPDYCEYVTSESQKKLCIEKATEVFQLVVYKQAKEEKKPELCTQITDTTVQRACTNAATS